MPLPREFGVGKMALFDNRQMRNGSLWSSKRRFLIRFYWTYVKSRVAAVK
jgi:hypothetical protein